MIQSFAHKGLEKFFRTGNKSGIQAAHAAKLARILAVLDELTAIEQLNGLWRCHQLKGERYPQWSLTVSGNWRITFELHEGHVYIVNYEDYH
ncbi:type II toxin-antitoxin system RelE/ParE family toxin [Neisseria shayeganii]|uniref:Plasmid maintenance system killer protein n=1 Tax=Neisseria shayeganii 871 TaxID=1032488 RepID=G4CGB1_9NEIS|nr:type II toxin-antitoxin system RelE/ParE family toxin [Neisseria shayeganii]EGY53159.1 plasmid maintenance system killer protein [Neisseria shayeganii 871]